MYHYEYPEVNTPSISLNPQATKTPRVKGNKIDTIINGATSSSRHPPSSILNADVHHNNKTRVNNPLITQKAKNSNKGIKKVILIGDSHARNCSFSLQDNLNSDYQVMSVVKPGAKMCELVKTMSEELKSPKDGDLVILWGGTNDIGKNNTKEALNLLLEFVTKQKDLNILIVNSPHRHDLVPTSCVNLEVEKFNRKLNKIMKLHPNVLALKLSLERSHFTNHGLHLNFKGKNLVSQNHASVVHNFAAKANSVPIPASWTVPPLTDENDVNNIKHEAKNYDEQCIPSNASRLKRNCPSKRDPDFLWSQMIGRLLR